MPSEKRMVIIERCRDCLDCFHVLVATIDPDKNLERKSVCRSTGEYLDIIEDDKTIPDWCPLPKAVD